MIEAAANVGVNLVVFSSVGGPRAGTDVPHFDLKFEIERCIEDLNLPATIIWPALFMQNFEALPVGVRCASSPY